MGDPGIQVSRRELLWYSLPFLAALLLYGPALPTAGWVLDDTLALASHAHHGDWLGEWTHPTYAWAGGEAGHIWRPVPATLQHWAALALGRTGPVFRTLNLGIHLLNLALVMGLARSRGGAVAASLLGLLLVTHPAVPEAVCWSSDLYDLCLTTCLLLATRVLLSPWKPLLRGGALAGLLLLAGLCKETALAWAPLAVALPLVLSPPPAWRRALEGLGAAAVGLGIYTVLHGRVTGQDYGGALGAAPLTEQVAAWLGQVGRLVWIPVQAPVTHLFDPANVGALGAGTLTLLAWGAAVALTRGGTRRAIAAAGLAWAVMLAPTGAGIPLTRVDALRYAYPGLALALALLGGVTWPRPRVAGALALVLALVFAVRTGARVPAWKDDLTLSAAELAVEPENPYALGLYAHALVGSGRMEEGLAAWREAVETIPPDVRVFDRGAERFKLAQAAFLSGRPHLALEQVERLHAQARGPVPALSWCLRADALDALGRSEEARQVEGRCGEGAAHGP